MNIVGNNFYYEQLHAPYSYAVSLLLLCNALQLKKIKL